MKHFIWLLVFIFSIAVCGCGTEPKSAPVDSSQGPAKSETIAPSNQAAPVAAVDAKSRHFVFNYKFRVKDLKATGEPAQDLVRVWIPVPTSSEDQIITRMASTTPVAKEDFKEAANGNRIAYLEFPIPEAGEFDVDLPYDVVRHEVGVAAIKQNYRTKLDPAERQRLLAPSDLVPTSGKALELIKDKKLAEDPLALARQLYDVVDEHVAYKKEGTGWGRGDTNWVCDHGYGNCTDFHSLFMSLARSQGLPSQFEIGFSIPTDKTEGPIAGYHCWAWFHTKEKGWVPVDISEADKHPEMKDYYFGNLTADRVTFSVGRDLQLVPPSASAPLNFFIYPHIEVGGKLLPKENLELQFSFQNK